MCFGGGKDNSAAIAAQQDAQMKADEAERQAKIAAGQGKIDEAFGQFDTPYFQNYQNTYKGFYNPQIADQYKDARGKLIAALAGRGVLDSSIGANALARVEKQRADSEGMVANQAVDASNQLRGQVEQTKTNLYNLNRSAADPDGIAARATGEATAIAAPQSMSPLSNVFASAVQPFVMFNSADRTSMNPQLPWNRFSAAPLSGAGSSLRG
jgi:hypothetical protein